MQFDSGVEKVYPVSYTHLPQEVLNATSCIIRGHIDPALLANGTPEEVYQEAARVASLCKNSLRFILGSGCEITAATPQENLFAMIKAGRSFGDY